MEFLELNLPEKAHITEFISWIGVLGTVFIQMSENLAAAAPEEKEQLLGLIQIQRTLADALIRKLNLQ